MVTWKQELCDQLEERLRSERGEAANEDQPERLQAEERNGCRHGGEQGDHNVQHDALCGQRGANVGRGGNDQFIQFSILLNFSDSERQRGLPRDVL